VHGIGQVFQAERNQGEKVFRLYPETKGRANGKKTARVARDGISEDDH